MGKTANSEYKRIVSDSITNKGTVVKGHSNEFLNFIIWDRCCCCFCLVHYHFSLIFYKVTQKFLCNIKDDKIQT